MPDNDFNLIHGDARQMPEIHDRSVHLIVTSPPYWQIKDYGPKKQIGYHQTYEEYINNLNLVWSESFRILENGCRLCINIGDQYARAVDYGRYKVIPIRTEIIKYCECIGLDYMGSIIWQKVSNISTTGGGHVMGSYPYPRNGILKLDYEYILIFKKSGKAPAVNPKHKKQSALTNEEWKEYFSGHWKFPGVRQKEHLAMFPEELPRRLIKMFSFVGDHVFDPFLGSGTTMKVAKELKRRCSGYEINSEYITIIKNNLDVRIKLIVQENGTLDYSQRIQKQPYIFRDPNQIKKLSEENKNSQPVEEYFKVVKVLSPLMMELNDGNRITLLGLREFSGTKLAAVNFLVENVLGKHVFFRLDDNHDDSHVYLYLKNKTFINAHLIKKGLVKVDTRINFHHKRRFMTYLPE